MRKWRRCWYCLKPIWKVKPFMEKIDTWDKAPFPFHVKCAHEFRSPKNNIGWCLGVEDRKVMHYCYEAADNGVYDVSAL